MQRDIGTANNLSYRNDAQPITQADQCQLRWLGLLLQTLGSTMIELELGDEFDGALFYRLVADGEALGGSIADKEWNLGGSREVTIFQFALPDGEIEAVAGTFIGLSLRGTTALVEQLARKVMPHPLMQRSATRTAYI